MSLREKTKPTSIYWAKGVARNPSTRSRAKSQAREFQKGETLVNRPLGGGRELSSPPLRRGGRGVRVFKTEMIWAKPHADRNAPP